MYLQGSAADKKVRLLFGFAFKDPAPHAHPLHLHAAGKKELEECERTLGWSALQRQQQPGVCVCVF